MQICSSYTDNLSALKPFLLFIGILWGISISSKGLALTDSTAMRKDLALLKTTISENHVRPFFYCDKSVWDQAWENLWLNCDKLTREEIIAGCISVVSRLQDEHTMVFPKDEFTLPFRLKWAKEGPVIYVTDSIHQHLLNTTVLEINGTDIFHAKHLISTLLKQDNLWYLEDMSNYFLHSPTILSAKKLLNKNAATSLKVKDEHGNIRDEHFNLIRSNVRHQWIYATWTKSMPSFQKSGNYWFYYDEKNRALYFNYEKCKEDPNYPFKKFLKDFWECANQNHPKKIIIDLRSNPGGNSAVLHPFIKKIASSPYNEKGKLFVLIGTKVISSSLINAVQLKQKTKAIFIGQPSSGNLIHFGEIKSFELPALQ